MRDFRAFGEPGAVVYLADCVELVRLMPAGSVDAVFADPPYATGEDDVASVATAQPDLDPERRAAIFRDLASADALAAVAENTVATLLPGVEFCTRSPYPDAARLLSAGVAIGCVRPDPHAVRRLCVLREGAA